MTEDIKTEENVASGKDEQRARRTKLSITMDKRIELTIALVAIVVGVLILFQASDIPPGLLRDPLTNRGMPYIMGILMIIGAVSLVIIRVSTWSAIPGNFVLSEGHDDEEGHPASWKRAFGVIVAAWLWVLLLKSLGYLIVTPLFLFAYLLIMDVHSRLKIVFFPTLYTLITWYIFSQLLKIILPLGPLTSFARSLGLIP